MNKIMMGGVLKQLGRTAYPAAANTVYFPTLRQAVLYSLYR